MSGNAGAFARRGGGLALRVVALLVVLGAVGLVVGWTFSYPLRVFRPEVDNAVRLDQARLAGNVLPEAALITGEDLGDPWKPSEALPLVAIGTQVCGADLVASGTLGTATKAPFQSGAVDGGSLLSEVQRFDRFNDAAAYVSAVASRADDCGKGTGTYFIVAGDKRIEASIKESSEETLITDQVRLVVSTKNPDDGKVSEQFFGMMAVGDLVTAYTYVGPTPRPGFLPDIERKLLARLVPDKFGNGSVAGEQQIPSTTAAGTPQVQDEAPTTEPAGDVDGTTTAPPVTAVPSTSAPTTTVRRSTTTTAAPSTTVRRGSTTSTTARVTTTTTRRTTTTLRNTTTTEP